ncbi:right-handed parallel beta-helix repeat-containing protein [Phormidium sp. CLA17]|uniref:right-handed parallel beta-helix repeat-containing protein n=1 Tax=Leptolyngbya sp. Cla-17 TaxID=2803751 RepID=UPI001490E0FB|nr:right-handed parallel beta-helix repeat-containing protein [Leptolyngbya sp. Cla-17]MBM0740403.1 right-handed parallel beta-helix repeat-containing protein [Leptolyngbya sp. Cla-17]
METQFLEAVFSDSIQHPNFFNGRILTATDLRDEQVAELKRSRYLGQAIGAGVVYGLNVTAASSRNALEITSGLAINRRGDTLHLPGKTTTVELVLTERPTATATSPFVPCDIAGATTLTGVVSTGFYLLAITNATRLSVTMAPNSSLNGDRPGCTNRYEEVGVQFKLVPLTNEDFVSTSPTALIDRSRLAHRCFGTNQLTPFAADPVHAPVQYGLLNSLRADKRLTDCDVPLALFQFQPPTVKFVDVWAVRRPCLQGVENDAWLNQQSAMVGLRRMIEAKVFFLQFQHQLEDIRQQDGVNIRAVDYFEYLPAAGYLPVGKTGLSGFKLETFFSGITRHQVSLDPVALRRIFHESFSVAPIKPGTEEIAIYPVSATAGNEPYVVFMRSGLGQFALVASGNCTYTLNPSNWEASLTQIANGLKDIHICLQTGTYILSRPIEIKNKGHIKITGAGTGTRLLAQNSEAALRFENCQSVTVRDLYAENGLAVTPQGRQSLQGTLSFYDCQEVNVENATLKCVGNAIKTSACITVAPSKVGKHQLSSTISNVRVHSCNLEMGPRQVGILLVNTRYVQVENNRLAALSSGNPSFQGIVIGGSLANGVRILNNTIENTLQGIHIGLSHNENSKGAPDIAENIFITGNMVHVSSPNLPNTNQKRHGVFVGNCSSLVIENNYLTLRRFNGTANLFIDGIRVFGTLGRRIVIRQNHLTSINALASFSGGGIQVTNLGSTPEPHLIENNFVG